MKNLQINETLAITTVVKIAQDHNTLFRCNVCTAAPLRFLQVVQSVGGKSSHDLVSGMNYQHASKLNVLKIFIDIVTARKK